MRFFSADYIFPISSPPMENAVVVTEDNGIIREVLPAGSATGSSPVEKFQGILCPGFVNAHCHLELSWMKGKIPEKNGIDEFIRSVEIEKKSAKEEAIQQAMVLAETEMLRNGIVAAGDISNGNSSFELKKKKNLHYHTFIEAYAFHPDRAEAAMHKALKLQEEFLDKVDKNPDHLSITPHAPYSASSKLLEKITAQAKKNNSPLTIHNQESEEENDFFVSKKGKLVNRLESFGIDTEFWKPTGKSSLLSVLPLLPRKNRLQLVHNTVTTKTEIAWAMEMHGAENLFWCTCPNANLYIENRLPDYKLFSETRAKMTIGTDSLASNHSLSILDEMKTIARHAPFVGLDVLLSWATMNGAEFLGINNTFGSLEKGKQPGLLNIFNFGGDLQLQNEVLVHRII